MLDEYTVEEAEEATKLAQGVLHIMHSTRTLLVLVEHLIKQSTKKDPLFLSEFEKAMKQYADGKNLLEEIRFLEKYQ